MSKGSKNLRIIQPGGIRQNRNFYSGNNAVANRNGIRDNSDKFRMNVEGDVFAVISERYVTSTTDPANPNVEWQTELETFSLADAANPAPLGRLELARGERLFASEYWRRHAQAWGEARTFLRFSIFLAPVISIIE